MRWSDRMKSKKLTFRVSCHMAMKWLKSENLLKLRGSMGLRMSI
ncbi:hypothetical protein PT2222_330113 [Paraburkholderia tropica]